MAAPIGRIAVTQVRKPKLGETKPALVKVEVTVDLSVFSGLVRSEWEQLRQHDILFLLTYV
jgi:intron-binding protein aquarius